MYRLNSSVCWQHNQQVSFDVFTDYTSTALDNKIQFEGMLFSTLEDVPTLNATIRHIYNYTKVYTYIHIMV